MNLLVYYSLEGNCALIAKQIQKLTHCELLALEPVKAYPKGKVSKFIWGGKSVLFQETPKLLNGKIDTSKYDKIIIGTPIWAGAFTPPILSFINENHLKNKELYFFATHGGGGADNCFVKLEKLLEGNTLVKTIDFVEPLKNQGNDLDKKIAEFSKLIK